MYKPHTQRQRHQHPNHIHSQASTLLYRLVIISLQLCLVHNYTEPGPATDIKAIATSTSLAVFWTAPTGQQITSYQVKLKDVANTQKFEEYTSTSFDNLLPGKPYTVVVTPMYGSTLGEPAEGIFTTSKSIYVFFLRSLCNYGHIRMHNTFFVSACHHNTHYTRKRAHPNI